jgi:hypothetical protein
MEKNYEQAFPTQHTVADANDPAFKMGYRGMSLRDYFAAAALQGLSANNCYPIANLTVSEMAVLAYRQADAMLAARERKGGT